MLSNVGQTNVFATVLKDLCTTFCNVLAARSLGLLLNTVFYFMLLTYIVIVAHGVS